MRKVFYLSIIALLFMLVVFSCKNPNSTPNTAPVISFANFTTSSITSATLTLNFSDADGDIGIQQSDTASYDFIIQYYYKNYAGNFTKFNWHWPLQPFTSLIDSSIYTYSIPYIQNNSKNTSLNGQIIINMNVYRPPVPIPPSPTVNWADSLSHFRYQFYMYDRAGHKSNVVTTPEFDLSY